MINVTNKMWIKVSLVGVMLLAAFLIYHQFETITSAVQNLRNQLSDSSEIVMANCAEETDVSEQKFHFEKAAPNRQQAILNPGAVNHIETYLVPQITCPTAVRIGRIGDGGKWVCNPWRAPEKCAIYSFGVNNEVSFETDIFEATKKRCNIYCFDPGKPSEAIFKPFNGIFRSWAIVGKTDVSANRYSIPDIAANFNHTKIDFLKVDIEHYEYESFKALFASDIYKKGLLEICQVFIEFHENVAGWIELQKSLQTNGFYMFYKEANYYCPTCHEYSFINLNCTHRYGVYGRPFNLNFA